MTKEVQGTSELEVTLVFCIGACCMCLSTAFAGEIDGFDLVHKIGLVERRNSVFRTINEDAIEDNVRIANHSSKFKPFVNVIDDGVDGRRDVY